MLQKILIILNKLVNHVYFPAKKASRIKGKMDLKGYKTLKKINCYFESDSFLAFQSSQAHLRVSVFLSQLHLAWH